LCATTNISTASSPKFTQAPLNKTLQHVAVFIFGGFGIIGNIFIIVLALKYTVKRNLHHLIINMAVSDTLVVLMTWILQIPPFFNRQIWADIKEHELGALCNMINFIMQTGMWTTFLCLLVVTIERFRATRRTFKRVEQSSVRRRILVQALCWLSAMVLATFDLFDYYIKEDSCVFTCDKKQTHFVALGIVYTFLVCAYVSIFVLSIATLKNLSKQPPIENSLSNRQRIARKERTASAMKMVLSSLLLYFCCYCPYDVINILQSISYGFGGNFLDSIWINTVLIIFPLVNSCFSPVIYLIFLPDFRQAAKKVFCKQSEFLDNGEKPQHRAAVLASI